MRRKTIGGFKPGVKPDPRSRSSSGYASPAAPPCGGDGARTHRHSQQTACRGGRTGDMSWQPSRRGHNRPGTPDRDHALRTGTTGSLRRPGDRDLHDSFQRPASPDLGRRSEQGSRQTRQKMRARAQKTRARAMKWVRACSAPQLRRRAVRPLLTRHDRMIPSATSQFPHFARRAGGPAVPVISTPTPRTALTQESHQTRTAGRTSKENSYCQS